MGRIHLYDFFWDAWYPLKQYMSKIITFLTSSNKMCLVRMWVFCYRQAQRQISRCNEPFRKSYPNVPSCTYKQSKHGSRGFTWQPRWSTCSEVQKLSARRHQGISCLSYSRFFYVNSVKLFPRHRNQSISIKGYRIILFNIQINFTGDRYSF